MTIIDRVRDLLSEGQTQESLDELYDYVKTQNADAIDQLVILRARLRNLYASRQNGTIDERDAAIEKAKINEAILKLLPQLTPEYMAEAKRRAAAPARPAATPMAAASPTSPARSKWLYVAGGAAGLLLLLLLWPSGSSDDNGAETANPPTEVGMEVPPGTLLHSVLVEFGQAMWEEDRGQSTFYTDDGDTWYEEKEDGTLNTFKMTTNSSQYITLYDTRRELHVRLSVDRAEFHDENDTAWLPLFTGQWLDEEE